MCNFTNIHSANIRAGATRLTKISYTQVNHERAVGILRRAEKTQQLGRAHGLRVEAAASVCLLVLFPPPSWCPQRLALSHARLIGRAKVGGSSRTKSYEERGREAAPVIRFALTCHGAHGDRYDCDTHEGLLIWTFCSNAAGCAVLPSTVDRVSPQAHKSFAVQCTPTAVAPRASPTPRLWPTRYGVNDGTSGQIASVLWLVEALHWFCVWVHQLFAGSVDACLEDREQLTKRSCSLTRNA